jgi:hypothetical protein
MTIEKLEDGRERFDWHNESPHGMFKLGLVCANKYSEVDVTLNCNMVITLKLDKKRDEVHTKFNFTAPRGESLKGAPVTVTGTLKESADAVLD